MPNYKLIQENPVEWSVWGQYDCVGQRCRSIISQLESSFFVALLSLSSSGTHLAFIWLSFFLLIFYCMTGIGWAGGKV